jgi:hypothetical protein
MRDLPGIICNKEGQELGPAVIKDVTVLKHGKLNLLSILLWSMLDGSKVPVNNPNSSSHAQCNKYFGS